MLTHVLAALEAPARVDRRTPSRTAAAVIMGDSDREELLRRAAELLAAVERFRRGRERELPTCAATLALLRERLRET